MQVQKKNTFLVDSDYICVISQIIFYTWHFHFYFFDPTFSHKRGCNFSIHQYQLNHNCSKMAQSLLNKRLGGRALVEKCWQEIQEDKNGQDKRDRDKVGFFACFYLIFTLILFTTPYHHHHHHQREHHWNIFSLSRCLNQLPERCRREG